MTANPMSREGVIGWLQRMADVAYDENKKWPLSAIALIQPQGDGWQPIETIPDEGRILARSKSRGHWFQGDRSKDLDSFGGGIVVTDGIYGKWFTVDAWMPLPPSPTEQKAKPDCRLIKKGWKSDDGVFYTHEAYGVTHRFTEEAALIRTQQDDDFAAWEAANG